MAASQFLVYANAALGISKKSFDLSADTFVMILLSTSYTPAQSSHKQYNDVSGFELPTSGGYTVGGVALSGVTDILLGNNVVFSSAPATWAAFSAAFRYPVVVRRAGGSLVPSDLLLCYCDGTGGGSITGGGGILTITPNAAGIFEISV